MMKSTIIVFAAFCLSFIADNNAHAEWTRFRGPNGSGAAEGKPVPTEWSDSKNLKWSVPLLGKGSSSPIVTNDRVYVTCYTGYGLEPLSPGKKTELVRHLIAFDRQRGKELWRASVKSTGNQDPYQGFLVQHGYASSTPTTDGKNIYAFFGKSGLYAFDLVGKQLWKTSLGTKSDPAKWGGGSSPILYENLVIVNAGIVGNQFIAVDKNTGKKKWSITDPSFTNCWSTPIVIPHSDSDQILFQVPKKILAINPQTGKKLWQAKSPLDDATCASIVYANGNAYLMGSRAGKAMAVKCEGQGNISERNILWNNRLRAGICTPLIVGKNLYWTTGGIFYAADRESGNYVYKERLPKIGRKTGGFFNADYSSPVASGNNIILFTRYGESYVIKAGDKFSIIGHNPKFEGDDTSFNSTPAISNGEIFIRSESKLYCIASEKI